MTVIAAIISDTEYGIAGDSGAFDNSVASTLADPKVWKSGPWLVGVCGSLKIMEIARTAKVGEPYALRDVIAREIAGLNVELGDWEVLTTNGKGLWSVGDDLSVCHYKDKYMAVGQTDIALGALSALYMTSDLGVGPILQATLAASALHNVYVQSPYKILTLPKK
jgi:hypothetical protein